MQRNAQMIRRNRLYIDGGKETGGEWVWWNIGNRWIVGGGWVRGWSRNTDFLAQATKNWKKLFFCAGYDLTCKLRLHAPNHIHLPLSSAVMPIVQRNNFKAKQSQGSALCCAQRDITTIWSRKPRSMTHTVSFETYKSQFFPRFRFSGTASSKFSSSLNNIL